MKIYIICIVQQSRYSKVYLNLSCFEEVREKSSHYGLNMLGYTRATRLKTIRCYSENWSKSL